MGKQKEPNGLCTVQYVSIRVLSTVGSGRSVQSTDYRVQRQRHVRFGKLPRGFITPEPLV